MIKKIMKSKWFLESLKRLFYHSETAEYIVFKENKINLERKSASSQ